jgi:hypothetical protein
MASTETLADDKIFASFFCFAGGFDGEIGYSKMSRLRVNDAVAKCETALEVLMSLEDRRSSEQFIQLHSLPYNLSAFERSIGQMSLREITGACGNHMRDVNTACGKLQIDLLNGKAGVRVSSPLDAELLRRCYRTSIGEYLCIIITKFVKWTRNGEAVADVPHVSSRKLLT